jgi:uncharacterized glyoxalase superfamily protein PhnB
MSSTPKGWPRISSSVFYTDARAAIDWLCRVFGFELRLKVEGEGGAIEHCELSYAEGVIMVGQEGHISRPEHERMVSPRSTGGRNTQLLCVYVDDVDAHCARASGRRRDLPRAGDERLRRRIRVGSHVRRDRSRRTHVVFHAARARPALRRSRHPARSCPSFRSGVRAQSHSITFGGRRTVAKATGLHACSRRALHSPVDLAARVQRARCVRPPRRVERLRRLERERGGRHRADLGNGSERR